MVIIWPSMTWMIWGSPWTWLMLPCQCSQVFLRKLRRWGSWYRFDGEEMAPALCHHIAIILPSLCHHCAIIVPSNLVQFKELQLLESLRENFRELLNALARLREDS